MTTRRGSITAEVSEAARDAGAARVTALPEVKPDSPASACEPTPSCDVLPSDLYSAAKAVVDGLSDAALLFDASLRPLHFNPSYLNLSGQRVRGMNRRLQQGRPTFDLLGQSVERDQANAIRCLKERKPIHLADVTVSNSAGEQFVTMQSFIPIYNDRERCVAAIEVFRDVSGETRMHTRYKELLALETARAAELERQVAERTQQLTQALEEVTRLSRVDPLTQVSNRRAFTEHARAALAVARRHGRCAAILMCDLDHFKQLNDRFGHQAGDAVLVSVAQVLTHTVRESDEVARFGGEEFVILLTETSVTSVEEIAGRCAAAVRDLPITELVSEKKTPQTISIGAAILPDHGSGLDDLISKADQALYHAKQTGRDRTVIYNPEVASVGSDSDNQPLRALVFDANAERGALYQQQLGQHGYDVVTARSVEAALAYCARQSFDVLVADEDGETQNGVALLSKSLAFLPSSLRILVLASPDSYVSIQAAHRAGISQLLVRDTAAGQLLSAIEEGTLRRSLAPHTGVEGMRTALSGTVGKRQIQALDRILKTSAVDFAFQPIVKAGDEAVLGYEALCRPRSDAFSRTQALFDTAAATGTVWLLGRIVRQRIMAEFEQRRGSDELIFINLHPAEIGDQQLLEATDSLQEMASRVVFEITERAAIADFAHFHQNVTRLREQGYRVAVDDLGSGYASLNSVAILSPDFVKIDMAMIRDIDQSLIKQRLLQTIVRFADDQGIQVVAEGIESDAEAEVVRALGCHLLQGHLLGRPGPLPERQA